MYRVRRAVTFAVTASASFLLPLAGTAVADDAACLTVVLCPPPAEDPPAPAPERQPAPAPQQPAPEARPAQPTPAEATARLLALLNRERRAHGLPTLTRRPDVDGIAASWSRRVADDGRLSHNDAYFSAETRRRLDAKALGENVARNHTPEDAHAALMASPGHRANILDRRFLVVGLGAVHADGSWWITQNFLEPRQAAAAPRRAAVAAPAAAPSRPKAPPPRRSAPPAPAPASAPAPAAVPVRVAHVPDAVALDDAVALVVEEPATAVVVPPRIRTSAAAGDRPYRAAGVASSAVLVGFTAVVLAEHRRRRWVAAAVEGSRVPTAGAA